MILHWLREVPCFIRVNDYTSILIFFLKAEINLLSRKHSLKVKREGVCDPDRAFKGINAFSSCRKTSFLNSFSSAEGC